MKLSVVVVPRAHRSLVERIDPMTLRVAVTAPPHNGGANDAVRDAVAEYLGVPRSHVRIVRGHAGRRKILEIDGGGR